MNNAHAESLVPDTCKSFGSFGYRSYVLITLTIVYTLNFVDRVIISVVGRPIIDEFGLSAFQFGILSGIGFTIFYTLLGIPIARLSERYHRVRIIGSCIILWSVATLLCGFTVGFVTLLLARMAVGVGEAGCTPPANSLINDYYRPEVRPTALSIYAIGVMLGAVIAQLAGGYVLKIFTWREAFIYVAAPGVLIGLLVLLTIKEPPRGYSDPPNAKPPLAPGLKEALAEIMAKRSFWMMAAGTSMATFAGYGLFSFKSLYIQYAYGFGPGETAIRYMAPIGLAGALGTTLGGYVTQLVARRTPMAPIWVPATGLIVCAPFLVAALLVNSVTLMFMAFMLSSITQYFYLGAQYNITQSVVSLRLRATAVAILLLVVNLVGYGLGPPIVGLIADMLTNTKLADMDVARLISANCSLADTSLGERLLASCQEAKAYGTKWASVFAALFFILAGVTYFLAGKTFLKDSQKD